MDAHWFATVCPAGPKPASGREIWTAADGLGRFMLHVSV